PADVTPRRPPAAYRSFARTVIILPPCATRPARPTVVTTVEHSFAERLIDVYHAAPTKSRDRRRVDRTHV
ncbi:MAG: hypothetical protein ACRDQF_16405, partial [Thermocrispum sp.]